MSSENIAQRSIRPGLARLDYRTGTHSAFLERMRSRLASQAVESGAQPLQSLTTRDRDDATLAFLDAWATALDVLSFYQERIANEGYLRTAEERRSVQELARSIGYELKPGVAANAYLSFRVEEGESAPEAVLVPTGAQALSIPGQDQLPQTFETSEPFTAKPDWNSFGARLREDQQLAANATEVILAGTGSSLQTGDLILIVDAERQEASDSDAYAARIVSEIIPDPDQNQRIVRWLEPLEFSEPPVRPEVFVFAQRGSLFGSVAPEWDSLTQEERDEVAPTALATRALVLASPASATAAEARFATGGDDGYVYLWEANSQEIAPLKVWSSARAHDEPIRALAYTSEHGGLIISASADDSVRIWRAADGSEVAELMPGGGTVWSLAIRPDGNQLAVGTNSGSLHIYDLSAAGTTGVIPELSALPAAHSAAVRALVWTELDQGSGNVYYLISGGADARVRVRIENAGSYTTIDHEYDTGTGTTVHALAVSFDDQVAEANDRLTVIVAVSNRQLIFWHPDQTAGNATAELKFNVPDAPANALALPPNARNGDNQDTGLRGPWPERVLLGAEAGSLQEWFVLVNDQATWPQIEVFDGHDDDVGDVAYFTATRDAQTYDAVLSGGADTILRSVRASYTTEQSFNVPLPVDYPAEWPNFSNQDSRIDLDSLYPRVLARSWVVLENAAGRALYRVNGATGIKRADFLLNERVTRLDLDTDARLSEFALRDSSVYLESEAESLAVDAIVRTDVLAGDRVDLDRIVVGLETGRPLIVSGRRARKLVREDAANLSELRLVSIDGARTSALAVGDVLTLLESPAVGSTGDTLFTLESETGFVGTLRLLNGEASPFEDLAADPESTPVSEVALLKNTLQSQKFSTLEFETPLQFSYDRATVSIEANVVQATHGERVQEILGSGDGQAVFQNFALKDPPLTYVSAPTPSGTESTLEVRVNDVLWEASDTLYGLGARDRKYAVRHEDDGSVRVLFGNGQSGERLPSGAENVTASYRKGIGSVGEIEANRLRILQNAPVGIAEVNNPLPASGSSAPEDISEARSRAPFSVLTLDRIVSLKDFQDFAQGFGGIAKARATSLWQEEVQLVYITVAGENGVPVPQNSELYLNLQAALDTVRDPFQPVRIASYDALYCNVAAKLLIDSSFITERVFAAAETAVREFYEFSQRGFGQSVTAAEIIQVLEAVPGVDAVDFDQLNLISDALFNLEIDGNQVQLENTSTIREPFRSDFNLALAAADPTATPLSEDALVFEEKRGLRWVLREPQAADGYAVLKEAGILNVYAYPAQVNPAIGAELARRDPSGVFLPAQLLLLNPDAAGVILMEFTN